MRQWVLSIRAYSNLSSNASFRQPECLKFWTRNENLGSIRPGPSRPVLRPGQNTETNQKVKRATVSITEDSLLLVMRDQVMATSRGGICKVGFIICGTQTGDGEGKERPAQNGEARHPGPCGVATTYAKCQLRWRLSTVQCTCIILFWVYEVQSSVLCVSPVRNVITNYTQLAS